MQYDTPAGLRNFLRLCLSPGYGVQRTPAKLAQVMPEPLARQLADHAPHLGELRAAAHRLEQQTAAAHQRYADALAAWIADEQPATSVPLLDAVAVVLDATQAHTETCTACPDGARFADLCPAGQETGLAAASSLRTAPADTGCAHVAWDVTREYRNANDEWVQERRCADCPTDLPAVTTDEPHFVTSGRRP